MLLEAKGSSARAEHGPRHGLHMHCHLIATPDAYELEHERALRALRDDGGALT